MAGSELVIDGRMTAKTSAELNILNQWILQNNVLKTLFCKPLGKWFYVQSRSDSVIQACPLIQGRLSLVILPPSTVYTCPVTNPASSAARNVTSAATSSGDPVRPTGWILSILPRKSSA